MSADDTAVYTGTATVTVLDNVSGYLYSPNYATYTVDLTTAVNWGTTGPPVGSSDQTLGATFTQGYLVVYEILYLLTGNQYNDPGDTSWLDTRVVGRDSGNQPTRTPQNDGHNWNYTASNPYTVPSGIVIGPPSVIYWRFNSNSISNYFHSNITWRVVVNITVTRSCTVANITAPLCMELCEANPVPCLPNYATFCLAQGQEDRIGQPVCKAYLEEYIRLRGSSEQIDTQVRAYCAKRYNGFQDLLYPTTPTPQQQADIAICACNLTAKDVPDPTGIILYNRFYDSLVARIPGFGNIGFTEKCTLPQCASSTFLSREIPIGGCPLPQCLTIVDITNDGTINGNVTVSTHTNCSKYNGQASIGYIILIVLAVIVVLIIIAVCVVMFSRSRTVANTHMAGRGTSPPIFGRPYLTPSTLTV